MKLAFSGQARFPKFDEGYSMYLNRKRTGDAVDLATYKKIVREYCRYLADNLLENGFADLPADLGTVSAATFTRRPIYRKNKFVGYGKMDWINGQYDGSPTAFGVAFLPKHKNPNMRCFGFVANRSLFKRVKKEYESEECKWAPLDFNDDMV